MEETQQWLEEETFHSRCVDEETNEWLAHVEISTSCGEVLDERRTLDEYPLCDGDTLTVVVVPEWDNPSVWAAESRTAWDLWAARRGASQPAAQRDAVLLS